MIRLFSSDLATAIANLVVFLGLCWGGFTFIRPYVRKITQRLSSRSRKIRQAQILDEIMTLRSFRENVHLMIYEIIDVCTRKFISWIFATAIVIVLFLLTTRVTGILSNASISQHLDRYDLIVILSSSIIFSLAMTFIEVRKEIKIIKRVGEYNKSRRNLVREYLKLRELR